MAWVLENSVSVTGAITTPQSISLGFTTTVGRTLVVVVHVGDNRTVSSVSGGTAGNYTQMHAQGPLLSTWMMYGFADIVTSAVSSITVTLNASSTDVTNRVTVLELSGGYDPETEEGTSTGATNAATTNHDASTVTPTDSGPTLYVGSVYLSGSAGTWTSDADFTAAFTPSTVARVDYRIQSDNTAQAYTVATSNSRSDNVMLFALRGAAASNTTITPSVGSLALSGAAPTVSVSGGTNTTITPAAAALAIVGAAVTQALTVGSPASGALTISGAAPTVSQTTGPTIQPAAGALTLAGASPTVTNTTPGIVISPAAGSLSLSGKVPTAVLNNMTITPTAGALTLAGAAPNVSVSGSSSGGQARNKRRRGMLNMIWGR